MSLTIAINDQIIPNKPVEQPKFSLNENAQQHKQTEGNWLQIKTNINPITPPHIIQLQDTVADKTISQGLVIEAEHSLFQQLTNIDSKFLDKSAFIESIWLSDEADQTGEIAAATLYFTLRRARIMERDNIITLVPSMAHPIVTLLRLEVLPNVGKVIIDGNEYIAVAQRLKYSIYNAYQQVHGEILDTIKTNIKGEVLEMYRKWVEGFFKGPWASAIRDHTLSKEQYIYSLFNLHQYVRQTTQHLGRCIALAPTIELRNHFIYHLRGEVNHELIIENDLEHLSADVNYLKYLHTPHHATKEFMVVQESTIGFYQDTVLMLACPLAAEGMTSYITPDFLDDLYETIAGWGTEKPKKAAGFLTSHVNTDGGDDGHWINVVNMIERYVRTEEDLQRFLSVAHCAMVSFERGFNVIIDDMMLWSAKA